jgi:hypothetical protein
MLQQTTETLSDMKLVQQVDAESKFERVIGSAILVFKQLIGIV